jgi:ubiquinone/menaquinone biosynthesis C-methylase UbiE
MSISEELSTRDSYRKLFLEYGYSYKSLNWGSQAAQNLRFKVLSEVADLNGKRILDVGCGLGDFAVWLSANRITVDYTGLDLTSELIQQARESHPSLNFQTGSILDKSIFSDQHFDYVFASGIFYSYNLSGFDWMKKAINRMWELSREGVAFNSLSSWTAQQEAGEFYADPLATLDYCRQFSSRTVLRHDYHPRDFTIFLLKVSGA